MFMHCEILSSTPSSILALVLQAIPASLGQLQMLEVLNCSDNEISSIPTEVLTGCRAMHTLVLHANPVSPQVSTGD